MKLKCTKCNYEGYFYAAGGSAVCPKCGQWHGDPFIMRNLAERGDPKAKEFIDNYDKNNLTS